jgi:hypothetical protein
MVDHNRNPAPLMAPGHVVATPGALEALERNGVAAAAYVERHLTGDWGTHGHYATTEVTERERLHEALATSDDGKLNRLAVDANNGSRVMSRYVLPDDTVLWVSTEGEGEHRNTCLMLPSEY